MKEIGNRSEGGGKSGVVQLMEVGKNTCSLSGVQCQRFKDHHQLHLHLYLHLHEHSEQRSDLSLPGRPGSSA